MSQRRRRRTRGSSLVRGFVAALLLVLAVEPVAAQESTTTSSTSTSTTSTTPTTAPPSGAPETTTTTSPPPPPPPPPSDSGHQPGDDAASDEVPQEPVVVPPPAEPIPEDPTAPVLRDIAASAVTQFGRSLRDAAVAARNASEQVARLDAEVTSLQERLSNLQGEQRRAVARLQRARQLLRRRAVASYMGTPAAQINHVLDAGDFNDFTRRLELLSAVMEADRNRVDEYEAAKKAVSSELASVVETLDDSRATLSVARAMKDGAEASVLAKQVQFTSAKTGGDIIGAGFVFPVGGPHSYSDTFGAPRMFGTPYAHLHEGTDIFAAHGTPLLACERGVLVRVGTDRLGGTKLWLVGASGTRYYYAHLSGYAEGVEEGKVVEAGDVVGFVGNTGNALTTPAHLHFEVHPGGGPAINPYPMLRMVDTAKSQPG